MVELFNPPNRNQIARIANGDVRLIKAFEQLFEIAGADVFLLSERVTVIEVDVAANTSGIAINSGGISANSSAIAANAALISANAANISANTVDIAANAANIATNTVNISANATSILANEPRIGAGQSWQDVSGSRVDSTSYQNGTDRPIQVNISGNTTERAFEVSTDGSTWVAVGNVGGALEKTASSIIPSGHYYRVNGTTTITIWSELR